MRFCAASGVTQFLDIGSGLPTSPNVHEVAQQLNPDSRVVYVDNDPVVVSHAQALLSDEADPFGAVARIRAALSPGSYLVISHADVSTAHAVGTRRLSETAREMEEADKARAGVPSRSRDEIAGFFGDLTLVEPGLTDVWAWRPEGDQVTMTSDYLRIIGGVARKG